MEHHQAVYPAGRSMQVFAGATMAVRFVVIYFEHNNSPMGNLRRQDVTPELLADGKCNDGPRWLMATPKTKIHGLNYEHNKRQHTQTNK